MKQQTKKNKKKAKIKHEYKEFMWSPFSLMIDFV